MKGFEEGWERWVWAGLGALVVAVGITLIVWFPSGGRDRPLRAAAPDKGSELPSISDLLTEAPGIIRLARRVEELRAERRARDPFLSSREQDWMDFARTLSHRPPSLDGIVDMEGNRLALIKGRIHRVGDEVDGFVIEEIRADSVTFLRDGLNVTVRPKSAGGRP